MSEQEHILITIDIATIDWTEGEHAGFSFILKQGTCIKVDWGDGHTSKMYGSGDSDFKLLDHRYKCDLSVPNHYKVMVSSTSDDAIIGFCSHTIDMEILGLDISNCHSMEILHFEDISTIDLSLNSSLKDVNLGDFEGETVDVSKNHQLERFSIRHGKVKKLSFINNPILREVNCSFCYSLKKVAIPNDSQIEKFEHECTSIHPKSLEWIEKIITRNSSNMT